MSHVVYSIILDFAGFSDHLLKTINANLPWIMSMIGLKIGLKFLRDSID